jgi:hypothetical protein
MSLTGLPLLALSVLATGGALVLLAGGWHRRVRSRVAIRTLGIVLCEVLALASVGLAVNRNGDFYPSWSALLGGVQTRELPHAVATDLARWLHARAPQGLRDGLVFTWKPPTESAWHLAEAPIVYVPPAYFHHAAASFPVVLVVAHRSVGADRGAWDDRSVGRLVHSTPIAAVLVLVRAADPADPASLGVRLPARLDRDLGVAAHGWAVIGVGADAATALRVYAGEPGRFSVLGLLPEGSTPLPAALLSAAHALPPGSDVLVVGGTAPHHPAGRARPGRGAPGQRLTAALAWAYTQLPPALAAPLLGA